MTGVSSMQMGYLLNIISLLQVDKCFEAAEGIKQIVPGLYHGGVPLVVFSKILTYEILLSYFSSSAKDVKS